MSFGACVRLEGKPGRLVTVTEVLAKIMPESLGEAQPTVECEYACTINCIFIKILNLPLLKVTNDYNSIIALLLSFSIQPAPNKCN